MGKTTTEKINLYGTETWCKDIFDSLTNVKFNEHLSISLIVNL